jgi:hypothetical protein
MRDYRYFRACSLASHARRALVPRGQSNTPARDLSRRRLAHVPWQQQRKDSHGLLKDLQGLFSARRASQCHRLEAARIRRSPARQARG